MLKRLQQMPSLPRRSDQSHARKEAILHHNGRGDLLGLQRRDNVLREHVLCAVLWKSVIPEIWGSARPAKEPEERIRVVLWHVLLSSSSKDKSSGHDQTRSASLGSITSELMLLRKGKLNWDATRHRQRLKVTLSLWCRSVLSWHKQQLLFVVLDQLR